MPIRLLAAVRATARSLLASSRVVHSGTFPGSTTYPGSGAGGTTYPGPATYPGVFPDDGYNLIPGRGDSLADGLATHNTLTATAVN